MITVMRTKSGRDKRKEGRPPFHNIAPEVEIDGLTVVVKATDFRLAAVDYSLAEDQEFDVTPDANSAQHVTGYLVEEVSSGSALLLVDEVVLDGEDTPYDFDGDYRMLHPLYWFQVPAGVESLADVEVRVHWIQAPEEESDGEG